MPAVPGRAPDGEPGRPEQLDPELVVGGVGPPPPSRRRQHRQAWPPGEPRPTRSRTAAEARGQSRRRAHGRSSPPNRAPPAVPETPGRGPDQRPSHAQDTGPVRAGRPPPYGWVNGAPGTRAQRGTEGTERRLEPARPGHQGSRCGRAPTRARVGLALGVCPCHRRGGGPPAGGQRLRTSPSGQNWWLCGRPGDRRRLAAGLLRPGSARWIGACWHCCSSSSASAPLLDALFRCSTASPSSAVSRWSAGSLAGRPARLWMRLRGGGVAGDLVRFVRAARPWRLDDRRGAWGWALRRGRIAVTAVDLDGRTCAIHRRPGCCHGRRPAGGVRRRMRRSAGDDPLLGARRAGGVVAVLGVLLWLVDRVCGSG